MIPPQLILTLMKTEHTMLLNCKLQQDIGNETKQPEINLIKVTSMNGVYFFDLNTSCITRKMGSWKLRLETMSVEPSAFQKQVLFQSGVWQVICNGGDEVLEIYRWGRMGRNKQKWTYGPGYYLELQFDDIQMMKYASLKLYITI